MPTYVLLGLGARPIDFEGHEWPFRGGRIGWIRWDNGEEGPPCISTDSDEALQVGADIHSESVRWRYAPDGGRFTITTDEAEPTGDELAAAVADGITGIIAEIGGPLTPELSIAPALEPEWVERGVVRLPDLEERDGWMTPFGLPAATKRAMWMDPESHRLAIEWVEPMLREPDWRIVGPFPAVIYHRLSLADFHFGPDEVRDVIGDREAHPVAPYEAATIERAFHAAFKGMEALLGGEPSKNERRFREQLERVGLDPEFDVHLPDERDETLYERVRRLHKLRDTSSAHGGRTSDRQTIRYYDVMEAQWILPTTVAEVIRGRLR